MYVASHLLELDHAGKTVLQMAKLAREDGLGLKAHPMSTAQDRLAAATDALALDSSEVYRNGWPGALCVAHV